MQINKYLGMQLTNKIELFSLRDRKFELASDMQSALFVNGLFFFCRIEPKPMEMDALTFVDIFLYNFFDISQLHGKINK